MNKQIRIIARLDIKGPNLVKGIHLEGLRVLGKPEDFAFHYYREGIDELMYMDVVASLYGRNNLLDIVQKTAEKVYVPLTVGGGIRTIDDIQEVLRAGADKVAINTAAIKSPKLISQAVEKFGSQCIVVSIEAKKKEPGKYEAYTDNGREKTGVDVYEWSKKVEEFGAGEILITSIDQEGTGKGFDVQLIKKIGELVSIPIIACGGAGQIDHFKELMDQSNVDALCAASAFHYKRLQDIIAEDKYKEEGNIEFLKNQAERSSNLFQIKNIHELKINLAKDNYCVRCAPLRSEDSNYKEPLLSTRKNIRSHIVIVDYGLGNIFSIQRACRHIGANVEISNECERILKADGLILPGVGAFGDGMKNLKRYNMDTVIKDYARAGRPLIGICLGMQLLLTESEEFGLHKGLDLIKGRVIKLDISSEKQNIFKVPHVGWSKINPPENREKWKGAILEDVPPGSFMYFVHSYKVALESPEHCLAETEYGEERFCSVMHEGNIFGCQFHPEMSGETGLSIYRSFLQTIQSKNDQNLALK